ncbi:hypothetical protein RI129_007866 [Pyrocoelia pectoralis]|uniref:peptide chain release factor N(5)-glutamine methyltransferase n=1 Tax=Pyrocoelia pectoralis TaxID=417401 RepID=A0AAN7VED7_9COLE
MFNVMYSRMKIVSFPQTKIANGNFQKMFNFVCSLMGVNKIDAVSQADYNFNTCTYSMLYSANKGSGSGTFKGNSCKKVNKVLMEWKNIFRDNNISEPKESIEHIIAHVLGSRSISSVYKNMEQILSPYQIERINEYCQKRMERLPVQYIIEEWDFRNLTLKMSPPVFIPRPETEMLVDIVLNEIYRQATDRVLEFCCGSGAISISLLKSRPDLHIIALDKSTEACELTKLNAKMHEVSNRLEVIHEDITAASFLNSVSTQYDIIVSNPPYIFENDMIHLQSEIKLYEDPAAFNGGADGLKVIKHILKASFLLLNCKGKVFLEVDPKHPPLIKSWLQENYDTKLQLGCVYKDFSGKERFVEIIKE